MRVVIASKSPVKEHAVKRGFASLFPEAEILFETVSANSGVSAQPMTGDEMREGAFGRLRHARELSPDADFYVALEAGAEEMYEELWNYGWVVIESKDSRRGYGRTVSFALPRPIRDLILKEGLEQSHATDVFFKKSGTKTGTGTIGPLTNDVLTYTDWYMPAVICALVPFVNEHLY
ncbi:MAG TPA: inosine/xanthosine triphosphatase [Candidatus Paceibacterota bacterium]|nr:inosine/xanthosine triphosphatase [Candidatus Paceibacterota bacterium]